MADLRDDAPPDALMHEPQIPPAQFIAAVEAAVQEQADPLVAHDRLGVVHVEARQTVFERDFAIADPDLPFRIVLREEDGAVDALDQRVLGRKMAIEQGLRDTAARRQFSRLSREADLGKERRRRLDDSLFALLPA